MNINNHIMVSINMTWKNKFDKENPPILFTSGQKTYTANQARGWCNFIIPIRDVPKVS
jgi:hypothetical protein